MPRVLVTLNGTEKNPFEQYGFKQNPFPRLPKAEYSRLNNALARLAAEPMPTKLALFQVLAELGGAQDFNDACAQNYREGEMATFYIEFPD